MEIEDGNYELLFLITLLLPATVVSYSRRWKSFGGVRYSYLRAIAIVTVFAIADSLSFEQFFFIMLLVPWLILLSQTSAYSFFRIASAVFAGVVAIAWIVERNSGAKNIVTDFVSEMAPFAPWGILPLAAFSIFAYWKSTRTVIGVR